MKFVIFLSLLLPALTPAAIAQPLAAWKFDALTPGENGGQTTREEISGERDIVSGNAWLVPGVSGKALALDGITAYLVHKAEWVPSFAGAFTVEAWVAVGAYPFNWCPIVQQQDGENAGYFFGIGDQGQVVFNLAADGKWQGAETSKHLPLRAWVHLAGVYAPGKGVTIYINGRPAATQAIEGKFIPATHADLWIGRNMTDLEQAHPVGKNRQVPTGIFFDGILADLVLCNGAQSPADLAAAYEERKPLAAPELEARVLPAGPPGPGSFGAFYTRLKYYKGWDDYWRVGDSPDVVVRFDQAPYRFVFWRGTSYIPNWVTENGIWYNNEFTEDFEKGLQGSAEPMSDKQCRFSHVRILESNPARVVIHWRYEPVDVNYTPSHVDPLTDWGDWTDELYTLYPDGVGIRKITVHTSAVTVKREWHEGIVVMSPGMSPNDAIEPEGLTLINDQGTTHTYSWKNQPPPKRPADLPDANIQLINTKSKYKSFAAVRTVDKPWFDIYAGEIRPEISMYPWWNHWPTAFGPSNGRYAQAADRASHSSLTHLHWNDYATGQNWAVKIMLHGMTDRPASELAAVVRSWEYPAPLTMTSGGFSGGDYDQAERAYALTAVASPAQSPLSCTLAASTASPIHNLAFIIKNWGAAEAVLTLNGRKISRGPDFRLGHRETLESNDLIVWIKVETTEPLKLALIPKP